MLIYFSIKLNISSEAEIDVIHDSEHFNLSIWLGQVWSSTAVSGFSDKHLLPAGFTQHASLG